MTFHVIVHPPRSQILIFMYILFIITLGLMKGAAYECADH